MEWWENRKQPHRRDAAKPRRNTKKGPLLACGEGRNGKEGTETDCVKSVQVRSRRTLQR